MLSPSLLLNNLDTQSRKAKLLLPATPIGIVEYLLFNTFVGNPLSKQLSVKWSLTGGEKETFLKVIIVSYERWSLTIESKYRDLTWKLLVFRKLVSAERPVAFQSQNFVGDFCSVFSAVSYQ